MGTVTPVVVPGEGYVRVEVDWRDFPHTAKCWIYRRVAGVRTMLREGSATRLSGGIAVAFDHEMPYDVPVEYSSVMALNANGDFEDGVSEWLDTTNSGTIGVVTQSKAYYVVGEGIASAKLVPTSGSIAQAVSEYIPATAGTTYTISGRVMASDYWAGGVGVRINWYNGASLISTVGAYNDFAPVPGEFGTYGFSAAAPATTTQMRIMFGATGSPPRTMAFYGDEMYVTTSGFTATAASQVIVPSDGVGWWVDPLHPATKTRLILNLQAVDCVPESAIGLIGFGPESFPGDEEALPVNNLALPIGAWQVRKGGQQTMQVATVTLADLAQLKALHGTGAPLLLQLPAEYGEAPAYQLHGDLEVARLAPDHRHPWRLVRSSFAKVLPPVGPAEGTWHTRYMDFTKLSTFADVLSYSGVYDTYSRTVANGWGTSNNGLVTTTSGGAASVYSTNGTQGVIAVEALNALRLVLYPVSLVNFRLRARSVGFTPTGGNPEIHYFARYVNSTNFVRAVLYRQAAGGMTVRVSQVVAGVETATGFVTVPGVLNNSTVRLEFLGVGTDLAATVWLDGAAQPQAITVVLNSVTMLTAGQVGSGVNLPGTVTNVLPLSVAYDDLNVTAMDVAPTWLDGLQGELTA